MREIRAILARSPVTVLSLRDFPPIPEPDETGATFQENARLKATSYDAAIAKAAPDRQPWFTIAEDSGLVIDALDGEPGVLSARFLRPDATYPERFGEISRRLAARPAAPRTARFVCAIAGVHSGTLVYEATGLVEGEIAESARGSRGFGYDPIFYYPPYRRTLGETTDEEKQRVAHRGQAFRQLATWLEGI